MPHAPRYELQGKAHPLDAWDTLASATTARQLANAGRSYLKNRDLVDWAVARLSQTESVTVHPGRDDWRIDWWYPAVRFVRHAD